MPTPRPACAGVTTTPLFPPITIEPLFNGTLVGDIVAVRSSVPSSLMTYPRRPVETASHRPPHPTIGRAAAALRPAVPAPRPLPPARLRLAANRSPPHRPPNPPHRPQTPQHRRRILPRSARTSLAIRTAPTAAVRYPAPRQPRSGPAPAGPQARSAWTTGSAWRPVRSPADLGGFAEADYPHGPAVRLRHRTFSPPAPHRSAPSRRPVRPAGSTDSADLAPARRGQIRRRPPRHPAR